MIRIAEAYSDENGQARDGQLGDQNEREIRIKEWYKRDGGWSIYIECTDPELAASAAEKAELIAKHDQYGYNQSNRWSGYKRIIEADGDIAAAEAGDFDCSSHVLTAYILSGLDIKPEGYTGNIERILLSTGKFKSYKDSAHTDSAKLAKRGSMYLEPGSHVMMVLDDAEVANGIPVSEDPRVYAKGSVRVRESPIDGATIRVLHDGESLPLISTWHAVEVDGQRGYISANERYTEVM